MKKLLLIGLFGFMLSCSNVQHPDFAANVESAKTLLDLQGTEADLQAQLDLVHEDMQWQPAFHGSSQIGKEAFDFANTFFSTSLDVQSENNTVDITVSPNPVVENLTITTTINNLTHLDIYNALGVKVFSEEIDSNNSVNISNLKTGVYFVKIYANKGNLHFIKKIIKSN